MVKPVRYGIKCLGFHGDSVSDSQLLNTYYRYMFFYSYNPEKIFVYF